MSVSHSQSGSFILRRLIDQLPLSTEGAPGAEVRITCVEVWNQNIYIGTSAAEILHFVLIPPDSNDPFGAPTYILASRLQPAHNNATNHGVQQILLLPRVNKACILCNNSLTFYSLPELSPAFANTKPLSCTWVGGVDQNADVEGDSDEDGVVVMICLKSRIRLVRIGEEPRRIRDIEFGGCLATARRDDFACASDSRSYALLDVVHQQKIPLFAISSLDEEAAGTVGGGSEDISTQSQVPSRSVSSAGVHERPDLREQPGHGRSTSLNVAASTASHGFPERTSSRYSFDTPESLSRMQSPQRQLSPAPAREQRSPSPNPTASDKALPPPPEEPPASPSKPEQPEEQPQPPSPPKLKQFVPLRPHVASPTPNEFFLTTGTAPSDPGVGMFVNLDGDVVRGSIEFHSYPESLVVDGEGIDMTASTPVASQEEGYVLAVIRTSRYGADRYGLEIQRWDVDLTEGTNKKEWLNLSQIESGAEIVTSYSIGVRKMMCSNEVPIPEISDKLSLKRLRRHGEQLSDDEAKRIDKREKEETQLTGRLCTFRTQILLWAKDQIWWIVRNPLLVRLDAQLVAHVSESRNVTWPSREQIHNLLNEIRGRDPRTEAEYLGLTYIKQKASLLLLTDLIRKTENDEQAPDNEKLHTEQALMEGGIDPRVVLSLLPILHEEVVQKSEGIWIAGGIKEVVELFVEHYNVSSLSIDPDGKFGMNLLQLAKRFLLSWRQKKGLPSIGNEKEVFDTVDAALLRLLLLLDKTSPRGPAAPGSIRAELNGVIDGGLDCFDRAIQLLEESKRLYLLSRLYQSRRKSDKVLATWKRIVEGDEDRGGELVNGEQEVRSYLPKIKNSAVVREYATWLANRNPRLGVEVFADDSARVSFEPAEVVSILRENAPAAVRDYLEYLVFVKKLSQYAHDLITFYLDIVLGELDSSPSSRETLRQTYITYRALNAPKPTYRQFITENASPATWWRSRLRLLQLLGGSDGGTAYDADAMRTRLEPFEKELIPEMIILNGKQGNHEEAIRLLTHGLGDFDTAISYCLLGGSSIFPSGLVPEESVPSRDEQSRLFGYLLQEFMRIEDEELRMERTGELLERFGGWFDVAEVLSMIPDDWEVEAFADFLANGLRRLVHERQETTVAKALYSARNLGVSEELIDKIQQIGPQTERSGA